ncbi:MAG: DUF3168 domain-containing protein [Candidatus Paceibacterota bacterium]|jgi:hypothetical protein
MSIEASIISQLITSGIVSDRVYPQSLPQGGVLPAIAAFRVSGAPLYADDGEAGLAADRLQIDCWSNTYTSAKTVATGVKTALSALRDVTIETIMIQYIMIESERDFRESGSSAAEYLYRTSVDIIIWSEN